MTHRIEIAFVGDAPDDEMARARILGCPELGHAIAQFTQALEAAGFPHETSVRVVRANPHRRQAKSKLTLAAE